MEEAIVDTPVDTGPAEVDTTAPKTEAPKTDDVPAKDTDWANVREKYAKGDEKVSKRLARYSSTEAAIDALISAQNRISSGELKAPLAKDATPEQVTAWREENGIPEDPTGYDLADLKIADDTKPVVDDFLKAMHAKNAPPELVKEAIRWNAARSEQVRDALYARDEEIKNQCDEEMREEWGSEFKANKNAILSLLDTAPKEIKEDFLGGRMGDGTPIFSNKSVLRWMANLAREVNPAATVVPGSGTNAQQAIESELETLNKMMGDRSTKSEYWYGPKADKNQARYRDLIDVQSKIKR